MGVFPLSTSQITPALAVVAAHGLTDLDSWEWRLPYATWLLLPLPGSAVTTIFCMLSIIHFSEDIRIAPSLLLHTALLLVGYAHGQQTALHTVLVYLCCVHVPAHYWRCWARRRYAGLGIAAAGTAATLALSHRAPAQLELSHLLQRIVIAHVTHELAVSERY